MPNGQQLS